MFLLVLVSTYSPATGHGEFVVQLMLWIAFLLSGTYP